MRGLISLYEGFFGGLSRMTDGWLLGFAARAVFAGVLLMYFLNAAFTKFEGGPFSIADAAYFQIIPPIVEAAGYDASQVAFFPWGFIVYLGSYSEIILPILIVIGLWTRIAALGMIGFTIVQSYVDIAFHGADEATVGAWFDNLSNAAIVDQRAFWIFLFLFLVLKGPGAISLDYVLGKRLGRKTIEPDLAGATH
ncbi:MAG: DoxX family protein [Pseudomonadota bacterium]